MRYSFAPFGWMLLAAFGLGVAGCSWIAGLGDEPTSRPNEVDDAAVTDGGADAFDATDGDATDADTTVTDAFDATDAPHSEVAETSVPDGGCPATAGNLLSNPSFEDWGVSGTFPISWFPYADPAPASVKWLPAPGLHCAKAVRVQTSGGTSIRQEFDLSTPIPANGTVRLLARGRWVTGDTSWPPEIGMIFLGVVPDSGPNWENRTCSFLNWPDDGKTLQECPLKNPFSVPVSHVTFFLQINGTAQTVDFDDTFFEIVP